MAIEAQVHGTRGRLEGDPQLRGHLGRIPFALVAESSGSVILSDFSSAVLLASLGSSASLSDRPASSARLEAKGASAALSDRPTTEDDD